MVKLPEQVDEIETGEISRSHDKKKFKERIKIKKETFLKGIICLLLGSVFFLIFSEVIHGNGFSIQVSEGFIIIVLLALFFEVLDSSTGMGFGTSLSPLLLLFGYDPLTVVPVLLISETVSGLTAGWFHHEFQNYKLSFSPINRITKVTLIVFGAGAFGIIISVVATYLALEAPKNVIDTYVSIVILLMAAIRIFHGWLKRSSKFNAKKLIIFSLVAGINKGIGGGGFGPVVTLGSIISGVYIKSAVAVVSLSEGLVSLIGVLVFGSISLAGVKSDLSLLPAVFLGSFLGGILSPYLVRIIPNWVWEYVVPIYAIIIGVLMLAKIYIFK